ncbi:MAG: hypothetical protein ACI9MC_003770, partial [Kiritimatiellia bacterium]
AYARNIALGLGAVAQAGAAPVEGFSNPLWVLLLVPMEWSGLGSTAGAKAMQFGLSIATIWGLGRVVLRAGGSLVQAWTASVALATSGAYVIWSAAGLEVALFAFVLMLTFALGQGGRAVWTGLAIGVCAWCRPEGMVPGLVAGCAGLWLARSSRRDIAVACGVALLPCAALLGLRWTVFGEVLPNPYYAKVGHTGLGHLWRGVVYTLGAAMIVGLPFWIGAAGLTHRSTWRRPALAAGSVVTAGVLMSVLSGGDWMLHGRFVAPYVPFIMVACAPAAVSAMLAGSRLAVGATLAAVACGVVTLIHASKNPTVPMDYGARMARLYHAVSDEGCDGPTSVAAPDVGALLYLEPALQVVDLGNLVEWEAARHPVGTWWPAQLQKRSPSMVQLHGPWAARTGLIDEVMTRLDYRILCRRTPTNAESGTVWLHRRCAAPGRGPADDLVRRWCAHGVHAPWPGERGALFR